MQQKANSKASKDKNKFKPLFTCVVSSQQAAPLQAAYTDQHSKQQSSLSGFAEQSEQSQKQATRPSVASRKQKSNNQASGRQAVSGTKGNSNTITIDLDSTLKQRGGTIDGHLISKDIPQSSKRNYTENNQDQAGAGTRKKTKRNMGGQAPSTGQGTGEHSAGAGTGGRLFIRPNHVNFSSRIDDDHAKSSKYNRRQLSSQGTGQIEQKSKYGTVVPMSPPASNNFTSHPRKTRAPRKQSKEIDKESVKQQMLATPNTVKTPNNISAYQTQSQPVKGTKIMQDVGKSSNDETKLLGSEMLGSPGANGRVDMLNKRIIDLTSEVRKDKLNKWNTRLQDTKNTRTINKEVRNRRNMKALQSLNSPQQNGSDWFSVGTGNQLEMEQKSHGAQNESRGGINNQQLLKLLDENRNSMEGPSQILENGEGEEASYRDGFGGTSWNSNLISNEVKHQPILRLVSPTACDIMGRNIDDLPQLDSRQLSEGEENVLATQRYTESSQQEERVHHQIFNQTSDQAAIMGILDCEDQPSVPYSERRTYKNQTINNDTPLQQPSRLSSCQVSVSERNSRNKQVSLSRIVANASQSENLTDDAENTYRHQKKVQGSKSNNRIEDYEGQSNPRRALSGLGSVGNLTGIGYKGELGRSYTRLKQDVNQQPQQSITHKKIIGKAQTVNRKEGKKHQDLLKMKSPKPGKSGSEVMSCKETRNASLRVEKPHESTRNSHVLKMSSLFGSKNEISGRDALNEHHDKEDERKKLVNAYYQKAELAKQSIHRPKVGGHNTQIKGQLTNSNNLNDSHLVNFKASPNDTYDSHQQNVCINSFQSVVNDKQRTAILERRETLKDLDSSKNMVKTQKHINFKSIFKMNNLHGSYSTQQQPDNNSEHNTTTNLARVPQSTTQDIKKFKDGYQAQGSGRIYSKLSESKNGLQIARDNHLNNSAFVANSNDRNFSKRNSINQVKEMSLGRANGSQTRHGAGIETKSQGMGKKRYQMDQKSTQTQLVIIKKDLKFITVNMLNMNLQIVDFQDNKLVSLPNEICQLSQLQKLKLDRNHLTKLPGNIGLLRKLEILNLTKNELTEIPPSLQHCKSLKEFYLSENKIEQLSPNIFNYMGQLETLHLHSNLMYQLPSSMANLVKLNSLSLEWFIYLDPPQQITQSGQSGATVINEVKTFCQKQIKVKDMQDQQKAEQRTFLEFMVQFYVCTPLKRQELASQEIVDGINKLRFTGKQRCLAQTTCSHKHPYLFQEIINSKSSSSISKLINQNYDLNVTDTQEQAPLLGSLRQQSIEYPKILLSSPNLQCLNLNQQSLKHGFPLHMAILSHKFEIALQMLKLKDQIDPNVLNSVGANVAHLLFVKYDKDAVTAFKILKQCIEVGVDLNLIDRMAAAPIHLALGKRQHQALKDMALLNKQIGRRVFDFNVRDKRGQTPLHYAVEKQDHEMFLALIRDEWVDPHAIDTEEFQKARRCSVIFSAFHHILYNREKLAMRRLHFSDRCLLKIAAMRELLGTEGCAVSSQYTLAWKRGSQSSQVDNQSHQSKQSSVKKNRYGAIAAQKEEQTTSQAFNVYQSVNQIRINEDPIGKDRWPQWQIRHPNSLWKDVPNQLMIDDVCQFQDNFNVQVTHKMFNLRAKKKMEREQAMEKAKEQQENQALQQNHQSNLERHSIAQENPYDVRGRAANMIDHKNKTQVRSLSRISHLSYKSDANAFKKIHNQSASKSSNANTQKMKNSRKLDQEMYHTGNHYFKSEARRQIIISDDDVVDLPLKSTHQRQKSTVQVSSKQKVLDDRGTELLFMKDSLIKSKSNIHRMGSQIGNKGLSLQSSSFLSEQQQQMRMRKLLTRKQKSSSFDCDLQSQINNEYNSGEMMNVERMSRLQEAGNKIEYIFHNNNAPLNPSQMELEFNSDKDQYYDDGQKKDQWQQSSMQTLMKKARNEFKNQNMNIQRGSKSSQKDVNKSGLSFMSPSNYQKSMLQERKIGDALPREQIKNHSFNTRQQASRPKTSFIDSYYNLSNSKLSSQAPMEMKKSTGLKVQPKIFGPKPEGATQAKSLRKGGLSKRTNNGGQNIDDVEVQIEDLGDKKEKNLSDNDSDDRANCKNSKDKQYDSGRIYISNLNINFNNVFINVKDVSIPSTPSSRAATRNDYATEPMDFSNIKGCSTHGSQIHKNIPSIRNIFAAQDTKSNHNQQKNDLRSDIEMLVKSNVQNLRGNSGVTRQTRQQLEFNGAIENAAEDARDKHSSLQRISMQKMKKIVQK